MKRRPLRVLATLYALLVLYGSLMPFDFTHSPAQAAGAYRSAWRTWPLATDRPPSRSDLLANLLLYVPLGALLAAPRDGRRRARGRTALLAVAGGVTLSAAVELLQTLSPTRTAGVNDLVMNAAGTALGAGLSLLWGERALGGLRRQLRPGGAGRPLRTVAGILILLLALDALWPLLPTLQLSALKDSAKHTLRLLPLGGFTEHAWHHWVVVRAGVWGILAAVLGAVCAGDPTRENPADAPPDGVGATRPYLWGALAAILLAALLEAAKVFIVGRFANPANVLASGGGAVAAMAIAARLRATLTPRGAHVLAGALLGLFVVYLAWAPFNFALPAPAPDAPDSPTARLLPLYDYALHGHGEQVRLFVWTILLLGATTYALQVGGVRDWRTGRLRRALLAAWVAGLFGAVLEFGQVFLPTRTPSTTDILCFALGGVAGSLLATARHGGEGANGDRQTNLSTPRGS